MIFRNCYFEYAGVYSGKYNLKLCYIQNQNHDFASGGDFELKTGKLPLSHEQLYYGKDYSEKPLEFPVEILFMDDNKVIPYNQMMEIKNWLFEQDGYKKLVLKNELNQYHLKCVFVPDGDITVNNNGYKGIRCILKNASPFWYGREETIVLDKSKWINTMTGDYSILNIDIPYKKGVNVNIKPNIMVQIDKTDSSVVEKEIKEFSLSRCNATNVNETRNTSLFPNESQVAFDISYLGDRGNSNAKDTVLIRPKYSIIESQNFPNQQLYHVVDFENSLPLFYLKYGNNYCRLKYGKQISSLTISYTPVYRLGAF